MWAAANPPWRILNVRLNRESSHPVGNCIPQQLLFSHILNWTCNTKVRIRLKWIFTSL